MQPKHFTALKEKKRASRNLMGIRVRESPKGLGEINPSSFGC